MITEEELATMEARVKATTPGPWDVYTERWHDGGTRIWVKAVGDYSTIVCRTTHVIEGSTRRWAQEDMAEPERAVSDAAFIAHACTDVPTLIEEVRRLRKHVAGMAEAVQEVIEWVTPFDWEGACHVCSGNRAHIENCAWARLKELAEVGSQDNE